MPSIPPTTLRAPGGIVPGVEKFEFPVNWGIDLQSEHERYLTEKIREKPVIVMNYPKTIKALYMRLNDDGRTVVAMARGIARASTRIKGAICQLTNCQIHDILKK